MLKGLNDPSHPRLGEDGQSVAVFIPFCCSEHSPSSKLDLSEKNDTWLQIMCFSTIIDIKAHNP